MGIKPVDALHGCFEFHFLIQKMSVLICTSQLKQFQTF